jgi:hypothetical protein
MILLKPIWKLPIHAASSSASRFVTKGKFGESWKNAHAFQAPTKHSTLNLNVEAGRNFSLARLTLLNDHLV